MLRKLVLAVHKRDLPLFGNYPFIDKKVDDYEFHCLFAEKKSFSYLIFHF